MNTNEFFTRQKNEQKAGERLGKELLDVLDRIQDCAGGTVKCVEHNILERLSEIDTRVFVTDLNPTDDFRVKFLENLSSYLLELAKENKRREV